jgi:hypothetical protein
MSTSNFALTGEECCATLQNTGIIFWRRREEQVFERFSKFGSSVTSVENAEYLGHPSSKTDENVDWMIELVHKNRRITICEVANMPRISFWPVQSITKDDLNTS